MDRLKTIAEFEALAERLVVDEDRTIPTIVISAGTCGQASGANDLIRVAKRELLNKGLVHRINLRVTGCHGYCEMEPSVLVEPAGTFYPKLSIEDMVRIVEAVDKDEVLDGLLYVDPLTGQPVEKMNDLPFYRQQVRTLLSRNQQVDPTRIYNYIANGGYAPLVKTLAAADPTAVLDAVKTSGLRGRGGAGFPTGRKWEMLASQPGGRGKYLVCNADEGDPGAYMDRSVLEGNPHTVIEGMLIGAFATGATNGVLYVRNEYPLAIKHLIIALRQARELGLLGEDILGTGFSFDLELVRGAGAFVCGEETALIRSIEGRMGEPRQRPPFPVQRGIHGRPTAINNVETWANIPIIFDKGASEYAKVGTEGNSGTKIFSLVGKVRNTGLVEVPMGMTISEIVYDIGGGPIGNAKIKAVQTGGPSGGCIPASMFDLRIDYDSLAKVGSIMGSGGMIVMDENTCMVDIAKYFMGFLKDESCGKCFTCRKGTQRMHELLDDISRGKATFAHLDLLEELAHVVKDTTMCGLGQTASNPVLSTLRYFRDEYEAHIVEKRCPAFVCTELVGAPCEAACPLGTEVWRYVAHIARGEYEQAYQVIREANPFPSVCARVCSHPCESRCRSGLVGSDPIAIRQLKRFVTDTIDPSVYKPQRIERNGSESGRVAVIGGGPSGMAAAHYLSLMGHKVTVYESHTDAGGMLISGIPSYRLPRETLRKEIESLLDNNVTLKCGVTIGKDISVEDFFKQDYQAVYIATGAHHSKQLSLEGEDLLGVTGTQTEGVLPGLEFLKAHNWGGESLARGRVGVIGGGDSAIDAARVAVRQDGVESVTILYRRTRQEMPALDEEVEAAIDEGVMLETQVSPVSLQKTQTTRLDQGSGGLSAERLEAVTFIRNSLGPVDSSGRRRPMPIPGSEFTLKLDTLLVAIGDEPELPDLSSTGIEVTDWGTLSVSDATLATSRPGVFAGGDAVTGPNTVVAAIADGKKAAAMIDRYLRGERLEQPGQIKVPAMYVAPIEVLEGEEPDKRLRPRMIGTEQRIAGFDEIELAFTEEQACRESRRCLRCDLEFTQPQQELEPVAEPKGDTA